MSLFTVEIQYPNSIAYEGPETYTHLVEAESVDDAVR